MLLTLLAVVITCIAIGVPLAFSLLTGVVVGTLAFNPSNLPNLINVGITSVNNPLLIAIPLLILAGEMLNEVGAIDPILDLADRSIGHYKGTLGLACVGIGIFFAGATGSSAAEAAAIAGAMKHSMAKRGYSPRYVSALVAASAALGVLFPPSLALIIYGEIVGYPVIALFKAAIFPGVIASVLVAGMSVILGRRALQSEKHQADSERAQVEEANYSTRGERAMGPIRMIFATVFALLIPVFVVGGVYSGILTLTEVATGLVLLIILYGTFVTRIGFKSFLAAARRGGKRAGSIFAILVAARTLSYVLVLYQVLPKIINGVATLHFSRWELLLVMNVALLVAGIFVDNLTLIIVGAPILLVLLQPYGITPVHLAIILAMNIEIGVIHPPVGMNLYAVSSATGVSVGRIALDVIPYICVLLAMLALVTFVPLPGVS